MNGLKAIIQALESVSINQKCAIATLVKVEGSLYRLPDARTLIIKNGQVFGMLSGES